LFDIHRSLLIEFVYMRQLPFFRLARPGSSFMLAGLLSCLLTCTPMPARAVELGDAVVRSHIGQPLVADIELTGIANDAATVQAGLADAEVYRGANIAIHPAVAALNIAITRRDGKRFLHLTSSKLVESEYVHIFFELNENGRRAVRQTTLWFTADPNPAPVKPAPAVAAAVSPVGVFIGAAVAVQAAAPVKPSVQPRITAAPVVVAPAVALVTPAPVHVAPVRPIPVLAAPIARPAACVQQFTAVQIGTCTALDAKNAALSAQIVDLEEKVRRLMVAMHAGAASQAPAAHAPPARAVPKPVPEVLAPMGAPVRKPAGKTPWLFIGLASAVVFAVVGVLLFLLYRKRRAAKTKPVVRVGPGFTASVRDRILNGGKAAVTATAESTTG
jgi:hypothetical protein